MVAEAERFTAVEDEKIVSVVNSAKRTRRSSALSRVRQTIGENGSNASTEDLEEKLTLSVAQDIIVIAQRVGCIGRVELPGDGIDNILDLEERWQDRKSVV